MADGAQADTTISIHALLAESDHSLNLPSRPIERFLYSLYLGRATYFLLYNLSIHIFLSTLSLRRATHSFFNIPSSHNISIHALLAESDAFINDKDASKNISIHALLAESDYAQAKPPEESRHFYPRSPCGERQKPEERVESRSDISIHALLAESD